MRRSRTPAPAERKAIKREALIYARVSSKEQEKEGFSIPAQLKLLNTYAEDQGFQVVKTLVDVETAKRTGRPGFQEMVTLFRKELNGRRPHPCRVLLVEKTDRLYRNLKDFVTLDELDLEIHMVKEGTVLSRDSHSSAKFMHGIKVLMAKNYVDNLSEETRKGMSEKAEEGIWPSFAPLGYRNVVEPGGKRTIEPDPVMAPHVTRLFEQYATGQLSLRALGDRAYEDGLVYRKSGTRLSRSQLHFMLNNPLYSGEFVWKGKRYRGSYPPLISRELFERCQEVLEEKGQHRSRQQKHAWAFQGLVFCGLCGGMLTAELKKGRYRYYHCARNDKKKPCSMPWVREEVLADRLGAMLDALCLPTEALGWALAAIRERQTSERRFHEEAVAKLEQQARTLQERLSALYVDKLDGKVMPEQYEGLKERWNLELSEVERRSTQLARQAPLGCGETEKLLELARRATQLYAGQDMKQKRRLLDILIERAVWVDGRAELTWRRPFDLLKRGEEHRGAIAHGSL